MVFSCSTGLGGNDTECVHARCRAVLTITVKSTEFKTHQSAGDEKCCGLHDTHASNF